MRKLQSGTLRGVANALALDAGYIDRGNQRAIAALDRLTIQGLVEVSSFKVIGEPRNYRVDLRLTTLGCELLESLPSDTSERLTGSDDPIPIAGQYQAATLTCSVD
ncbi:hypothetical protein DBR33_00880 [Stenotrophomonas sp. HMWF022]|uniref:hypothetical protein n=1 Tax=Stenotrophomonas sp. HMWF023 TaxID=2056859 RepID=UPI000D372AE1|nr:hypothetical protein [Stenotrophomonas sp. HMWF023]PTS80396.1 hypothetical protein DBR20_01980 [Stenotrophomonas sp. HMWF023]PTT58313.1 hypothetical protein DBR33_00880 [Stenotrophomonas sp. HMWF022]